MRASFAGYNRPPAVATISSRRGSVSNTFRLNGKSSEIVTPSPENDIKPADDAVPHDLQDCQEQNRPPG